MIEVKMYNIDTGNRFTFFAKSMENKMVREHETRTIFKGVNVAPEDLPYWLDVAEWNKSKTTFSIPETEHTFTIKALGELRNE